MTRIETGKRWYPRQHTHQGHIDPPHWGAPVWEPSDPARRVEAREHDRQRRERNPVLEPGMLVIHDRQPKRVIEIKERPEDLWPKVFEERWQQAVADRERFSPEKPPLVRATWRDRPIVIVLALDKPGAKDDHWCAPASHGWDVLPEHYMVCHSCGQLPPCDDELTDQLVTAAVGRTEHLMSIQRGCCLGCGDPITHRMKATRFPGPNLWRPDLGDNSAVFHARQACSTFECRYRKQWEAASKVEQPTGQLALGDGAE